MEYWNDAFQSITPMSKKVFCLALGAMLFALCSSIEAQQPTKVRRIGFLDRSTASGSVLSLDVFRQELSNLGWVEGKNVIIEPRFAEGKTDRLPELAAELVRIKVDLIAVSGRAPGLAAKKATTTIPILMLSFPDPVAAGMVASLARPGGNVTGLSSLNPELDTKRLEILRDAVPPSFQESEFCDKRESLNQQTSHPKNLGLRLRH